MTRGMFTAGFYGSCTYKVEVGFSTERMRNEANHFVQRQAAIDDQ